MATSCKNGWQEIDSEKCLQVQEVLFVSDVRFHRIQFQYQTLQGKINLEVIW